MTDHQDITTLRSELRQMRRTLDRQGTDSEALGDLLQASTQAVTELKGALALSHDQLRESRRHHLQLQTDLEALREELKAVQDKAQINLAGEQARHKSSRDKAAAQIAALKQDHQKALQEEKAKTEALSRDIAALKAENSQIAEAQQAAENARNTVAELKEALSERLKDISLLGEEIARLQEQHAQVQAENDTLNQARKSEVAELGSLLEKKDQAVTVLAEGQQRQTIMDRLKHPQESLHGNLSSRNFASSTRRKARARLEDDIRLISASELFDPTWYRTTYPDIGDQDPARHFALNGAYELRNPSAAFDSLKYHIANPDVTENAIPALMHYLRHGETDGRPIHPVS